MRVLRRVIERKCGIEATEAAQAEARKRSESGKAEERLKKKPPAKLKPLQKTIQ